MNGPAIPMPGAPDSMSVPPEMMPGMGMGEPQPQPPEQLDADYQPDQLDAQAQLDAIPDSKLIAIYTEAKHRSKSARHERHDQNNRNWRALHGDFAFLRRKQPGQSRLVIPALETSMEQICGTLTTQLVGYKNWFSCEYEGGDPPLPELAPDVAASVLRRELERLQVEGNYLATQYGSQRLIYDSLKVGLVESVVTWKVSIVDQEVQVYGENPTDPYGPPQVLTKVVKRLKVEIIPFADHFPDPSSSRQYDIHEVDVPIADLPGMGFDDATIDKIRGHVSTEKEEERRIRAGAITVINASKNRALLGEYWGDLIDPDTGKLLARNVRFIVAGTSVVVERPVPIASLFWHGRRPFITVPLIPTPLSHTHHAFLDIAVPLVETESELTNLIIDGGFSSVHGIKAIREYMMENPEVLSKGFVPGVAVKIAEGRGSEPVVEKIDTGTLAPETMQVADRIGNMRTEAFRINDLQLGRVPQRQMSATEVDQVSNSSSDLFSTMAVRFEDNGIETLIELSWLTMWQYLDDFAEGTPLASILGDHAGALDAMTQQERFVVMANGVRFKVVGYKAQQSAVKSAQKLQTLAQFTQMNPALAQVWEQEFSPTKQFALLYRSLAIDPEEVKRGPDEPYMDPSLLQGAAGNPQGGNAPPNQAPGLASNQEQAAPPNPEGFRGAQA